MTSRPTSGMLAAEAGRPVSPVSSILAGGDRPLQATTVRHTIRHGLGPPPGGVSVRATGGASLCVTRNRATVCNSSNLRHVCDGVQGVGTTAEIPAPRARRTGLVDHGGNRVVGPETHPDSPPHADV